MSKSRLELATTDYSNIICDPFMVRYAFHPTITTICGRRAPPHDLVKVVQAIVLASIWPEQFVALAGIQTNRDILEPGSQIALHFRIKRPFQPFIGAVWMSGVDMHHSTIRPTCCALHRNNLLNRRAGEL